MKNLMNGLIIIGKLFTPIGKVLIKLLKMTKVLKSSLIAGSLVAYSYMFTWQFALIILLFLFVHEYGHLWAMKRCKMKTKGIYFIPFIGAACVTDNAFKSYKDEVYIALMGPIWGLALTLIFWVIYLFTGKTLLIGAAVWMSLVTIFNLLPIMPLDGGRVIRSIAMSLSSWGGVAVFILGIICTFFVVLYTGTYLLIFFLLVGGIEICVEIGALASKKRKVNHLAKDLVKILMVEGPKDYVKINKLYTEIKKIKHSSSKNILTKKQLMLAFLGLLCVLSTSIIMVYSFKHIPGAELALQILEDKK